MSNHFYFSSQAYNKGCDGKRKIKSPHWWQCFLHLICHSFLSLHKSTSNKNFIDSKNLIMIPKSEINFSIFHNVVLRLGGGSADGSGTLKWENISCYIHLMWWRSWSRSFYVFDWLPARAKPILTHIYILKFILEILIFLIIAF